MSCILVSPSPPNKACTGQVGFVAISGIFLASSFLCSQTLSTPAHLPITQTVGRLPSQS